MAALVIHETILKNGDEELLRPISALAWSGLAAGLSMGFSFLTEALFRSSLPDAPWRALVTNLGYPLGFLIVIIGREQLFTENTLTAIIPLHAARNLATLMSVLKLWAVVLTANLVEAMRQLAVEAAGVSPAVAILRGVFAGWLIATVVWMLAATETARIPIIVSLTYVVGLAGLTHVVVGSVEVLFLIMIGVKSWLSFVTAYMLPTLVGNTLGGVSLASALNHAQVVAGTPKARISRI